MDKVFSGCCVQMCTADQAYISHAAAADALVNHLNRAHADHEEPWDCPGASKKCCHKQQHNLQEQIAFVSRLCSFSYSRREGPPGVQRLRCKSCSKCCAEFMHGAAKSSVCMKVLRTMADA